MILPFEEREYAPFENRLKSQVSPLSVEVSMPTFSAAKSLVPARAKELTPVKANCSTTSQEAPSSIDLQMKLSSATMIALSLTIIFPPFSMGDDTTCHVLPLSVDRHMPLPPTPRSTVA